MAGHRPRGVPPPGQAQEGSVIGRRVHHVNGNDPYHELTQPGDYCGPIRGYTGDLPAVFFIIPEPIVFDGETDEEAFKQLAHVCQPPHVFRECPDGSLEIRESILCTWRWKGQEKSWHGYLDEDHSWRTV